MESVDPATCFHGYRLDPRTRTLHGPDGDSVPLGGRPFDVLAHLVRHHDRVVGKDELLATVWAGRVVEENNLQQAIAAVRHALGTGAGDRRFILTVPGRGYRFVAEVEPAPTPRSARSAAPATRVSPRTRSRLARAALIALIVAAIAVPVLRHASIAHVEPAPAPQTTLAVLPFRSIGDGASDRLLDLGMAETLIARLSGATRLRVLSLASVQPFANAATDPVEAGRLLGSDLVVEGSTQRVGGAVRVAARLLAVADGRTLWAGTIDERIGDVFRAEDALAEGISTTLSASYAPRRRASACEGDDAEAYRDSLRGRYLLNRPNAATIERALDAFRSAIARDPSCARAWAGLAAAHRLRVLYGDRDPRIEFPLAEAAIDKALAIDPRSAEAEVERGFARFLHEWNWAGAESAFRSAIALDPNLVDAHIGLANLLNNIGRNGEASVEARRAAALDPLSPFVNILALHYVEMAGDKGQARRRLDQLLDLEPDYWGALAQRSALRRAQGDKDGAEQDILRAVELAGRDGISLMALGVHYARTAQPEAARAVLAELRARERDGYVSPVLMAVIEDLLGERDQALASIARALRQHDARVAYLRVWFVSLGDDPRYLAMMRELGIPAGAAARGLASVAHSSP